MNPALTSVLTAIARKGLTSLAVVLATHGIITSGDKETVIGAGLFLGSLLMTFWDQYGRTIVLAQLDMLKAKALAQAELMRKAKVPPVTATQIADKGPASMTPEVVVSVVKTMSPEIQRSVVPK